MLPSVLTRIEIKEIETEAKQQREFQRRVTNEPNVTGAREVEDVIGRGEKLGSGALRDGQMTDESGGEREDIQVDTKTKPTGMKCTPRGTAEATSVADTPIPL